MTYIKKTNPDWNPSEFPHIKVGDVVDFPGPITKLLQEGSAILSDKDGNEMSMYDALGIVTDRELEAFKSWREVEQQKVLREKLEKEMVDVKQAIATATAQVEAAKAATAPTTEAEDKKKAWAAKMAAARAKKAAEKAEGAKSE